MKFRRGLLTLLLLLPCPALAAPTVLRHDLQVRLLPAEQALEGTDRLTVAADGAGRLLLALAPEAEVVRVTVAGEKARWKFQGGELAVELPSSRRGAEVAVEVGYRAAFADEAPATPLNTEDPSYGVTGTISDRGAFLGGGAGWYPEIEGSVPHFRLEVETPKEMMAVSSGRLVSAEPGRTVWETEQPVRGLSLTVGPFRRHEGRAGEVPVYAFFYPESVEFARTYLEAAEKYLGLYQDLFGFYPFEKFAVAENFFPTGYGYPSWTLLGSTVVRLPFIVETSLGHEIAHSWWGNGVWVDYRQGNWSEGLTTYVADHLYEERRSPEAGRDYRLKILRDYATLVSPEKEIPLARFLSRTTAAEQAVGYGKAAMVFHMARRQIGDQAFWDGLRQVAAEKLFRAASWDDFAAALGKSGGTDLHDFFRQWVERPGAPVLALEEVRREKTEEGWRVTGVLRQGGKPYDLRIPVRLETAGGGVDQILASDEERTPFALESAELPQRLVVDPDVDLFRRLDPAEVPPTVNGIRGSTALLAIVAENLPESVAEAAAAILPALGQEKTRVLAEQQVTPADLKGHDLLFLGLPSRRDLLPPLPAGLRITADGFRLAGKNYHVGTTLFTALPHPREAGRVAALFLPASPPAAATAARKIPHYGKYSYLAFAEDVNVAKGVWPAEASPVIHTFADEP